MPARRTGKIVFACEEAKYRVIVFAQNHAVSVSEFVPKVFALLFRREGGDDFFEARITAERVPEGMQL